MDYVLLALLITATLVIISTAAYYYVKRFAHTDIQKIYTDSLSFPNHRSQYHKIGTEKIHYIVEGKGPFLLLIHGIGASIYCWRHLIPILAKDFTVCALDLPGFGESDLLTGNYSVQTQAQRLLSFLDSLQQKNVCLVGSSMGGAIACEMVAQRPAMFQQIVLMASAHDSGVVPLNLAFLKHFSSVTSSFVTAQLVEKILKYIYGKKFAKTVNDTVVKSYLKPFKKKGTLRAFFSSFETLKDHSLLDRFLDTKKKTLIVWGEEDRIVPVAFGVQLNKMLKESRLVIHPEAGHHLQEEDPVWLAQEISAFIRGL